MYATNPPLEVIALKAMLLLVSDWTSIAPSGTEAGIHYPSANPSDPLPRFVLEPHEDASEIIAPAIALPNGRIIGLLSMALSAKDIETIARSIKAKLEVMMVGLPLVGVSVGMCSNPTSEERADDDGQLVPGALATRTIPIVCHYRISP